MTRTATPVHLWIVGAVALLWNLFGALDYLMTQTQNEAYMARYTPEQLEYFYGFPMWVETFWALAVWGAVLGSILLLLRKGLAVPVFAVSFVSMVITAFYNYVLSSGLELMGSSALLVSLVIFAVALGLFLYARAMRARRVLT